ncbi:MAG TPA: twin-arginine translocase TatA/TatE family subunit [Polyangiaceae bacterium]
MGTLSPIHWILVAVVVLLVFGPKTLSKMGKSVGQGMRSVNKVKETFVGDPIKAITAPVPAKKRPAPAPEPASEAAPAAAESAAEPTAPVADAEPAPAAAEKKG